MEEKRKSLSPTKDDTSRDEVVAMLKTIIDPELYIDIFSLGLIYDITIEPPILNIRMTFTSMACPAGPQLVGEIQDKARSLPGIERAEVEVVFTPPWEPSDELKMMLGLIWSSY